MREFEYNGTVYRPPMEATTFLLPVTEGCTHNACRFCNMYKGVPFKILDIDRISEYMEEAAAFYHKYNRKMDRVYLVGADPFALNADKLKVVTDVVYKYAPECKVITMYAAVRNIMSKSDEELARIKEMGINDLYVGVESTLNDVLSYLNKGNSADDAKEQLLRLNKAGIRHMDMMMTGAAGKGRGKESGISAARFFKETKPFMIIYTTMSVFPGTELEKDVENGKFIPAREKEILTEEKVILENLDLPDTYFWAAHSLDSVRLQDYLTKENRGKMIDTLDNAINTLDEDKFEKVFKRTSL
ncbi:MAG: radical SAM protein [Butyrivibrio sp.]|nr:radical SAM protein [Butyrivibrio sp.]